MSLVFNLFCYLSIHRYVRGIVSRTLMDVADICGDITAFLISSSWQFVFRWFNIGHMFLQFKWTRITFQQIHILLETHDRK